LPRPAAAALLLLAACGKQGPPLPPIRILPPAPGNFTVRQIGGAIVVAADLVPGPEAGVHQPVVEARILRMPAISGLQPGVVSNRYLLQQFMRQARPIASLEGEALRGAVVGGRLSYDDREPSAGGAGEKRFLYSIMLIGPDGERSSLPLPALIEAADPPPAPSGLRIEVAEGEVRLEWDAGPAEEARYNVYRGPAGAARPPEEPLNRMPFAGPSFIDTTFRYGETYRYSVRAVAAAGPPMRESADGGALEVSPLDRFPPAAPTGLAVAVEGNLIRLYWFPNGEPDLAGYRVYRRIEPEGAPGAGDKPPPAIGEPPQRIAEVPADVTDYGDATAVPGVRYHYAVTAIDGASPPNESPRSEGRSEMLPPEEPPPGSGGPAREGSE
jgi:hypothetical protein